jgi:hypothetical protein
MVWNQNVKLGFKGANFFVFWFFHCVLLPFLLKFYENGIHAMD